MPLIVLFISLQIICGEAFTLQREREGEGELIYSCSNNAYSLRTPIYHSLAVGISTACSLGVVSADTTTAWSNKTLYGRVALTFDQAFNQNQSLIRVNQGSRCSALCPKLRPATSCLQMAEAVSIHCEIWFAEGTGIEASQPSKGTDYDEGGGVP